MLKPHKNGFQFKSTPANQLGVEHKFTPLSALKASTDERGDISGYRSVYSVIDDGGDICLKGCFADAIPEYLKSGFTAHSHDWTFKELVGYPVESYEDDNGWFVRSKFHSTKDAQDIRQKAKERMDDGKDVGFSYGYRVLESEYIYPKEYKDKLPQYLKADSLELNLAKAEQFSRIRLLKKLEVKEDSLVTSPMNTLAGATDIKGDATPGNESVEAPPNGGGSVNQPPASPPQVDPPPVSDGAPSENIAPPPPAAPAPTGGDTTQSAKAGARNSAADVMRLKLIHDNAAQIEGSICPAVKSASVVSEEMKSMFASALTEVKSMFDEALAEMTAPTPWQIYYAFLRVLDQIDDLTDAAEGTSIVVDQVALVDEALAAMAATMRDAALAQLADDDDDDYYYLWGAVPGDSKFKQLTSEGLATGPFDLHSQAVVTAAQELANDSRVLKTAVERFIERAKEKSEFRSGDGRALSTANQIRKAKMDQRLTQARVEIESAIATTTTLVLKDPAMDSAPTPPAASNVVEESGKGNEGRDLRGNPYKLRLQAERLRLTALG